MAGAPDTSQQRFVHRLTSMREGAMLKQHCNHFTPGAPVGRRAALEHTRGSSEETLCWPDPGEEPAVKSTILEDDALAEMLPSYVQEEMTGRRDLEHRRGGWTDLEQTMGV